MRIIKRIKDVNIENGRTVPSVMMAISEECGELAREVRVKHMPDCYKEEGVDGILGEGCDVVISTIDLMLLEGYSEEQIEKMIDSKLSKWISKANNK